MPSRKKDRGKLVECPKCGYTVWSADLEKHEKQWQCRFGVYVAENATAIPDRAAWAQNCVLACREAEKLGVHVDVGFTNSPSFGVGVYGPEWFMTLVRLQDSYGGRASKTFRGDLALVGKFLASSAGEAQRDGFAVQMALIADSKAPWLEKLEAYETALRQFASEVLTDHIECLDAPVGKG